MRGSEDRLSQEGGEQGAGLGPGEEGKRSPSSLSTSWVLALHQGLGARGASMATVPFQKDRRTHKGKELGGGVARTKAWEQRAVSTELGLPGQPGGEEPPARICTALNIFLHPLDDP